MAAQPARQRGRTNRNCCTGCLLRPQDRQVPRPRLLLNKHTEDAHDNRRCRCDDRGHLWIFSSSHGTGRPSFIHRSTKPWSIGPNSSAPGSPTSLHAAVVCGGRRGFCSAPALRGRQVQGIDATRLLFWMTSADGRQWNEPEMLAGIEMGGLPGELAHSAQRVVTAFDFHPSPTGLIRAPTFTMSKPVTSGARGVTSRGSETLPLTRTNNPALAYDSRAEGRLLFKGREL